ncbi:MAG: DNA polymerase IV [Candidatus Omnitrophica bacterium]|nr:DNA polymerase IV [Candidatus Omnitrophota bacterium]
MGGRWGHPYNCTHTVIRKIIHIDMDAFFAAVEIRDNPSLAGKPVVVGGNPNGRGVVSAASYEARKFGICSAMPAVQAKHLCPEAIFLKPNFKKYSEASEVIHSIFKHYTKLVESAGLDEAYLDVTENILKIEDPVLLAKMIQQNIRAVTKLTASAGVAPNKFLAKIASDMQKPAGLTVVEPKQVSEFLKELPVRKIPGVGPVSGKELNQLGIKTIGELALQSKENLIQLFGKWGVALYERAHGIDNRPVETEYEQKQIGSEETFERDLLSFQKMEQELHELSDEVSFYLERDGILARTVTLKVKYSDFTVNTRSHTLAEPFNQTEIIFQEVVKLLHEKTEAGKRPIRLLGVSVSGLVGQEEAAIINQAELFR